LCMENLPIEAVSSLPSPLQPGFPGERRRSE
jgi:hypothetical protein